MGDHYSTLPSQSRGRSCHAAVAFMLALLAFTPAAEAQEPRPASAYQGTIGEWALGRWDGTLVQQIQGERLHSLPRVLVVERHPDGWVGCKFTEPQCASGQFFMPKCSINASTITMVTRTNTSAIFTLSAPGRLEARTRPTSGYAGYGTFIKQ